MPKSRANDIAVIAPTAEMRAACLCFHAQRAARALARRFDAAFRPVGLTNGQYSTMAALATLGPASIGAIAAALGMDRTTLTAALKPLVRRRLVTIAAGRGDRRNKRIDLTKMGRATLAKAQPIWRATHDEVDKLLGAGGPDRLRQDLRALF